MNILEQEYTEEPKLNYSKKTNTQYIETDKFDDSKTNTQYIETDKFDDTKTEFYITLQKLKLEKYDLSLNVCPTPITLKMFYDGPYYQSDNINF